MYDRARSKTVSQRPHRTGTTVGNGEPISGTEVSGSDISAAGDEDPMVGSAADNSTGDGPDFDKGAVSDSAGRNDSAPFRFAGPMVKAEDPWRGFGIAEVFNGGIPIFCQNLGFTGEAIDRFTRKGPSDSDAVNPAFSALDLPAASGFAVGAQGQTKFGVIFQVALDVRAPPPRHLVRIRDNGNPRVWILHKKPERKSAGGALTFPS